MTNFLRVLWKSDVSDSNDVFRQKLVVLSNSLIQLFQFSYCDKQKVVDVFQNMSKVYYMQSYDVLVKFHRQGKAWQAKLHLFLEISLMFLFQDPKFIRIEVFTYFVCWMSGIHIILIKYSRLFICSAHNTPRLKATLMQRSRFKG